MPISAWRQIQRENFTSIEELIAFLQLAPALCQKIASNSSFPLNLPRRLAEKIKKGTLDDPILRQFVPLKAELEKNQGFRADPVGDCHAAQTPKYLKKYQGRALLLVTGACAMHCRFCFRQKYEYTSLQKGFYEELERIRQDASLKEIILSGGDPLSLGNGQLKELLKSLEMIPHLKRIRFHSRFPIGIPERIDEGFLELLEACQKQIWFVIHCNHAHELDEDVFKALRKIQKLRIPVLNQGVLLKGVNDSLEVLQNLCETLVDRGIFPYYLHQLDRVEGSAHFEVDIKKGKELISKLNTRLAGYGIPKYVQEIASESAKTWLF